MPLGGEVSLAGERGRLAWAAGRLPVPRVLGYGADDGREWPVTEGIDGASAVEPALRAEPARLARLLGEGLRRFHETPWDGCPFEGRVDAALAWIRARLAEAPEGAEETAALRAVLDHLERQRPADEDLVLCHGDYCVPNVVIRDWQVVGFVDLGGLSVGDPWRDLAVGLWSVTRNLGPGWEETFLEGYGVARHEQKVAYYKVLHAALP